MSKLNRICHFTIAALITVTTSSLTASPASARVRGLTVCNNSHEPASVALAQRNSDGWVTRGWWRIEAGDCQKVVDGRVRGQTYGIHAGGAEGGRWGREFELCVSRERFEYHYADSNCPYGRWARFNIFEVDSFKYTYTLRP